MVILGTIVDSNIYNSIALHSNFLGYGTILGYDLNNFFLEGITAIIVLLVAHQ